MLSLRLYSPSDPTQLLEERVLGQGEFLIGRGEDVDWRLADPTRAISRRHCAIIVEPDGQAVLLDLSANGIFVGASSARIPPRKPWRIRPPQTIRIGPYRLQAVVADPRLCRPDGESGSAPAPTGLASSQDGSAETSAHALRETLTSDCDPLVAAFCAGAQLEASAFEDDDPANLLRRLGEVYREMVLGLTNLTGERTSERAAYRMERTSIRVAGANPIRWEGARRAGVDLLKEDAEGFLPGPAAVAASFSDAQKHMACAFAGLNTAIDAVFNALAPAQIKRSAFDDRLGPATAWELYQRVYERHRLEARDSPDGLVNRAFRDGYAARLKALDRAVESDAVDSGPKP